MRVAALYDIHGNLPALEAALLELEREPVDRIVVGGDVLPGPMPARCLQRLLQLDVPLDFVRGNGEVAALEALGGPRSGYELPKAVWETVEFSARQLEPAEVELLATWPLTLELRIPPWGEVLFCHATPRDENEIFTRQTPDSRLRGAFAGIENDLVVCGHTHMQFDRRLDKKRVVNAGSVGLPFGEPGAHWLVVGPELEMRRTRFDLAEARRRILETDYPQAAEMARSVGQPPAEQDMLALFGE